MTLAEYYDRFGTRITQDSERLFVDEFLFPLLADRIGEIEPQLPFIDSTGRCRRIDFAYKGNDSRLAFEVNGETYHAEGVIAGGVFDDNLFRQNEILRSGYQNHKYNVADLERRLIVDDRNDAVVREYLARGHGDKAIGFCVSIAHAERMAEVFQAHGILPPRFIRLRRTAQSC